MAGWADSGSSRGRGRGGGFANRGVNNMNTRWRERRPAQNQQQQHQQDQQHQPQQQQRQQQQHRYRPVNDNDQSPRHLHHSPVEETNPHRGQGGFSTSTRRPQPTHPPPQSRPTFTDHKSPASAANADVNANEPDDKARRNAANFECNVCFDMADDPVVTKCGHLFCWECLYQWLHVHSRHRECPVCKGQVADDAIIPIYGRGGCAASVHAAPPRPPGARVESSRQQQHHSSVDWHMVDDDEDDNPLDELRRLAYRVSSLDTVLTFMPDVHIGIESYDDEYTSPYLHHDFDEVYANDLLGFSRFASAGAGSSRGHGYHSDDDIMEALNRQELDFVYRGGRRHRGRARGGTYTDHFEMEMGSSSSASYRGTGAGPHHINSTGASSRPNGGWTERRGRSNRNSNSGGGGRGMQNNSRRQGANYN